MALETGTYIDSLNASNPAATDGLAQADDHLRLLKSTIKATLPNVTGAVTATQAELNLLDGVTATTAEINYVDGVTSNVQTQLNAKQATITGAATTIDDTNLTASRALVSDSSGKVAVSAVTSTELSYLDGVTSNLQTQINNVGGYPQVITIVTSGNYSIPSNAQAIMIRASGGGGGGTHVFGSGGGLGVTNGTDGGSTTVTNSTLSIAMTATGGRAGRYETNMSTFDVITGSTGGDVLVGAGSAGGRSTKGDGGNYTYDGPASTSTYGNVVHKYVTGNNVGGETLTISYGAAGAAGSSSATAGQAGYVEIWVW